MGLVRLTYQELAARLNLSPAAARMRARRRRWPVTQGNDGKARVAVDEAELAAEGERVHERSPERSDARSPERSPPEAEQEAELERLRAEVLALTERTAKAEAELAGARELVDELRAGGGREQAALRELVDELRAQLARERGRRRVAEARLAAPWWLKLLGR
jgi:hypothetical protein